MKYMTLGLLLFLMPIGAFIIIVIFEVLTQRRIQRRAFAERRRIDRVVMYGGARQHGKSQLSTYEEVQRARERGQSHLPPEAP